jgi:hypothetical protein
MSPDDEIPEHDHLADATRRALGQLADTTATDSLSWGAVQSRARRVKVMRTTTAVAACVIVLAGVGAVIGTANRKQNHINVAGPSGTPTSTSEPTASTSSSAPATTTLPARPTTCPGGATCGILGVSPTTSPTPSTQPALSSAPLPGDFTGTMMLNERDITTVSMAVGDAADVAATIQNATSHDIWPSDSTLPTSVATVCTSEPSGRQSLWWMTNVPMAPGARSGRSGTFAPTDLDAGTVTCQVDIVSNNTVGTTFATDAGGDEATATILAPVRAVLPAIITVVPRAETTTTLPTATTVPETTTSAP